MFSAADFLDIKQFSWWFLVLINTITQIIIPNRGASKTTIWKDVKTQCIQYIMVIRPCSPPDHIKSQSFPIAKKYHKQQTWMGMIGINEVTTHVNPVSKALIGAIPSWLSLNKYILHECPSKEWFNDASAGHDLLPRLAAHNKPRPVGLPIESSNIAGAQLDGSSCLGNWLYITHMVIGCCRFGK